MAATKPISIKMPDPMHEEVEREGRTRRRSRSLLVDETIERYLITELEQWVTDWRTAS